MKCVVALVMIFFLHILFEHKGHTFKGINMCERDCELTNRCLGIYYDPIHLECRFLFDMKKSDVATAPAVARRIVKTSVTKDTLRLCSAKGRVVINGKGKHVCVPTEDTAQSSPCGRVLFAKYYVRSSLSQVTLGREEPTVKTYMHLFIKPLHIESMQYSSSLQSLFIAQASPNNIFSIHIRQNKKSVIRTGRYFYLRVDGRNGLLFAFRAPSEIYRMTTQGKFLRRVHRSQLKTSVRDLAIDPQHGLVYVVRYKPDNRNCDVISLNYSGGDVDVLFVRTQTIICYAVFDQMSDTLVYAENNKLMSYDLSTKEHNHSVLTTVDDIRGITVCQGTLYFVDGNSLMDFNYREGKKKRLVDLPEHHLYKLCTIS